MPIHMCNKYFGEWEFHCVNNIGKALVLYAPSSITFKGWLVHMGEWNKGCLFHTLCNNGLHNLVFYETFFSFPMCACNVVQCLLLIATRTSQSYALQGLLCQEQTNVSMHHDMIQCSFGCLGWNGALFKHPPSIILQT